MTWDEVSTNRWTHLTGRISTGCFHCPRTISRNREVLAFSWKSNSGSKANAEITVTRQRQPSKHAVRHSVTEMFPCLLLSKCFNESWNKNTLESLHKAMHHTVIIKKWHFYWINQNVDHVQDEYFTADSTPFWFGVGFISNMLKCCFPCEKTSVVHLE